MRKKSDEAPVALVPDLSPSDLKVISEALSDGRIPAGPLLKPADWAKDAKIDLS